MVTRPSSIVTDWTFPTISKPLQEVLGRLYLEDAANHLLELLPAVSLLLKEEVHKAHITSHDGVSS